MRELVGCERVSLFTDKLNFKRPREGSRFRWHQDSPYWAHFAPHIDQLPNVMLALDDATRAQRLSARHRRQPPARAAARLRGRGAAGAALHRSALLRRLAREGGADAGREPALLQPAHGARLGAQRIRRAATRARCSPTSRRRAHVQARCSGAGRARASERRRAGMPHGVTSAEALAVESQRSHRQPRRSRGAARRSPASPGTAGTPRSRCRAAGTGFRRRPPTSIAVSL